MKKAIYIDVIITLSCALLAVLLLALFFLSDSLAKRSELENSYQMSYYDVADNMQNIETKLDKLTVSNSAFSQSQLAAEIWRQSAETESNLAKLPLDHEDLKKTTRFVNQLGDYTNSLSKKLAKGVKLTASEEEQLEKLSDVCRQLNTRISALGERLGKTYRISDHVDTDKLRKGGGNSFGSEFKDTDDNAIEYPRMIYDGPFSDAMHTEEAPALAGKPETDQAAAIDYLKASFPDAVDIRYLGQAGGDMQTHELTYARPDGVEVYVQLTVKGLYPAMFSSDCRTSQVNITMTEAEAAARKTAHGLFDTELHCVWSNQVGNCAYFNLVPKVDGALIYPDMIKVKICLDDGSLCGLESRSFLKNHTERTLSAPALSLEKARANVNRKLSPEHGRLVLIPKLSKEILSYEFYGKYKGATYIVYIDAQTGEEIDILRIINDKNQGTMQA